MKIQPINNNYVSSRGLYFAKQVGVEGLFVPNIKTAEFGTKYIENTSVPQAIKDRFMENPYVKILAEKFDTFIFFREQSINNKEYRTFATIGWINNSNRKIVSLLGRNPFSQEQAREDMFDKLDKQEFSNTTQRFDELI